MAAGIRIRVAWGILAILLVAEGAAGVSSAHAYVYWANAFGDSITGCERAGAFA